MKRNKFSLSHYKLFTCDMGELIPCGMFEVLPGDTIQMSTSALVRAAPLLSPVMHPVHVRFHHWYVPYRLIWDNFEKFITGGADGMDATAYPTRAVGNGGGTSPPAGSLSDYLGVPLNIVTQNASALPYRAYSMIWNEFYRDQDLETELVVSRGDGADTTTNTILQKCSWEKDYFTSSRPWEQKGPAVTLPLGTTAPVISEDATPVQVRGVTENVNRSLTLQNGTGAVIASGFAAGAPEAMKWGTDTGLLADLASATAVTINTLREALAIQRFEEARARYGSRYTEYLRYLGVRSSDARLQRPEYLGGGKQTIQWSEVLQTGVTTSGATAGVGNLRGHGIGAVRSNRFRRFIEEHGLIMTLFSVRPRTIYMQGFSRMWNRRLKEDFWQKELEAIGQQEILNKEVYAPHASPDGVFGYQDRYDEYRRQESSVAGEFRTSTLNHWHMAREFASAPALNASFVSCVPTERTFAVPSEDVIYVMANHSIQARRMLSRTGSSFTF